MKKIEYTNDESYVDEIHDIVECFDCYEYISLKLRKIIKTIDNNIHHIILNNDDENNIELIICLYGGFYGFDYDYKNCPLISFYTNKVIIYNNDCGVNFSDDLKIDISKINFENFEKID